MTTKQPLKTLILTDTAAAGGNSLTLSEILNALLTLELKGLVMTDEHGCYSRG